MDSRNSSHRLSPIDAVRAAMAEGAGSRAGIARRTGLEPGTVDLILAHLEAVGDLSVETMSACPSGGCGSCAAASACGSAGHSRGPVMLSLRRRAPRSH
ncbi:FeoC-like transcriptional regulator [Corynebacterium sp.]|uniref:FeoC-like transcriptional regulator n=1 Tax=Corynebacterium sp. TaxID=1720 RepID=UPI0026DAE958|nr:FeoC-like transcriptional regulator [Corynebacterium sp.]MDO5031218.1 FeoC-like transcriptional regulator [Corynebacterium sp.]